MKIGVFIVACCFASVASAGLYKWVDENGRVNYSDSPPAHVKAETLDKMKTQIVGGSNLEDAEEEAVEENQRELCSNAVQSISGTYNDWVVDIENQRQAGKVTQNQYQEVTLMLEELKSMANMDNCLKADEEALDQYQCLLKAKTVNECL